MEGTIQRDRKMENGASQSYLGELLHCNSVEYVTVFSLISNTFITNCQCVKYLFSTEVTVWHMYRERLRF